MGDDAPSPLLDFIEQCGGSVVLDGSLMTLPEVPGAFLSDPLWDTEWLITSLDRIRSAHLDSLRAGANIILAASCQATIPALEAKGLSRERAELLLERGVYVARDAREMHEEKCGKGPVLVAASVGSYGACLADGSEYSGDYGDAMSLEALKEFHRRKVQILANSGADIIAFEAIPNKLEAEALAELLQEENITIPAWFCFISKDGLNVVSGDPIIDCASIADSCNQVVAVGINFTPLRYIEGLITSITEVTEKPVVVYRNNGETYDADRKEWAPSTGVADEDLVWYIGTWREAGASLFGGGWRTTPGAIRAIRRALSV